MRDYLYYIPKDYSEITPEYLLKMYNKMIFKKYNFKKLYLSFYSKMR